MAVWIKCDIFRSVALYCLITLQNTTKNSGNFDPSANGVTEQDVPTVSPTSGLHSGLTKRPGLCTLYYIAIF
jgi:hypothetical protein